MEGQLGQKASRFLRRRKKWLILLATFGVSSYGAYKIYHLPSVIRKRRRLMKLLEALFSVAELISDSAETIGIISRDLNGFLKSDSDEIPDSLKQISKIAKSDDFTQSLARVSEALTIGVFRGYNSASRTGSSSDYSSVTTDKVIDRVFSESGSGFVSIVVGSFAKNLVLGFYSHEQAKSKTYSSSSSEIPRWLNLLCNDMKCRDLIGDCIQKFVSTAVGVYLDRTIDTNVYDEIFAGLTNPNHRDSVRDILVSVCNGALETLVRTSHHKTKTPNPNDAATELKFDSSLENNEFSRQINEKIPVEGFESNGWVRVLSTTLAVPGNRKFVFEVTSRVTLETLRSLVEFFWWKMFECFRQSLYVVQDEAVNRGSQVVTYVGTKSSVIVTVCLALCLHVLTSTRVLLSS